MAITNPQLLLFTAGGHIRCARCTAQSSRTKLQCGRPALKTSKTQKCQFHGGGLTSGKQTEKGRSRIAAAHYKHGESDLPPPSRTNVKFVNSVVMENDGHEEEQIYRRTDHWVLAASRSRHADQGVVPQRRF